MFFILFIIFTGFIVLIHFGLILRAFMKHTIDERINEETPHVTILIPAFNEEKVIVETIKMCYKQTYENYNIVVINDGSTDNTIISIINEFDMEDKFTKDNIHVWSFGKIDLIAQENKGKSEALNFGTEYAKNNYNSEYILSVDADTLLDTNCLEEMMAKKQDDTEVMTCMIGLANGNKNLYRASIPSSFIVKIQWLEYLKTFVVFRNSIKDVNGIIVVPGACALYSMNALEITGGWKSNTLAEDMELTLNVQTNNIKIQYLSEILAWTQGPNNYKDLGIQRVRWKIGMLQSLKMYPNLLFQEDNKLLTYLLVPFIWFSEVLTPWVEVFLWSWLIYLISTGTDINWHGLINTWIFITGLHITNSILILAFAKSKLIFENGPDKISKLILLAIIEGFTYHFLFLYWGIKSQLVLLFSNNVKWKSVGRH